MEWNKAGIRILVVDKGTKSQSQSLFEKVFTVFFEGGQWRLQSRRNKNNNCSNKIMNTWTINYEILVVVRIWRKGNLIFPKTGNTYSVVNVRSFNIIVT